MPSVLDPPGLNSWDRQRDETPAQWFAFKYWRDRVRVTWAEVADASGMSPATIAGWAQDWSWKIRKADYDRWIDQGAQAAALVTEETLRPVHLTAAALLREAGLQAVRRLLDQLQVDPTVISASAAVRAVAEGTKLERLTLGKATEITQGEADYSKLTDEEFENLRALQRKAEGSDP